jgi:hypothetical protein
MKFLFLSLFIVLTGCSTSSHMKKAIIAEAKEEKPTESSDEVRLKLIEILNADETVTEIERTKLLALVDKSFSQKQELEILANQKKKLLLREFIDPKPNKKKIKLIQKSIENLYHQKLDNLMDVFGKMADIMKLHPKSSQPFFNHTFRQSFKEDTDRL